MKIVINKREDGEYDYRFVSGNGEILSVSEGFSSKGNAKRAVDNLLENLRAYPNLIFPIEYEYYLL